MYLLDLVKLPAIQGLMHAACLLISQRRLRRGRNTAFNDSAVLEAKECTRLIEWN